MSLEELQKLDSMRELKLGTQFFLILCNNTNTYFLLSLILIKFLIYN